MSKQIKDQIKSSKTSKILDAFQKSNEEYIYGFEGEKESLNVSMLKTNKNTNYGATNILKTSYKIQS